jgi:hypothetical protein
MKKQDKTKKYILTLAIFISASLLMFGCDTDSTTSTPNENQSASNPPDSTGSDPADPTPADPGQTPSPAPTPAAKTIYGVTIDSVANLSSITTALKNLSQKPTTRIVFDEGVSASYYLNATKQIHEVSYIMGEILDSFYVKNYSVSEYIKRTEEYYNLLSPYVDIWEVGNEINGEWLGNASDVAQKMTGAYDFIKSKGKVTALTLYYNEDCWMYPSEEMFTWANKNVPARMKTGLDYVLVSYYEQDCNGLRPDWEKVFAKLAEMFPNSKIGFGEIGTTESSEAKADMIERYYKMNISQERFIGGYFWWYFMQDMVPMTKPMWQVLNNNL